LLHILKYVCITLSPLTSKSKWGSEGGTEQTPLAVLKRYNPDASLTPVPFTLPRSWRLRHVPVYKTHNWLLGHLEILKPDHHKFLRATAQEMGGIFRLRVLWLQVPSSPVLAQMYNWRTGEEEGGGGGEHVLGSKKSSISHKKAVQDCISVLGPEPLLP